mmetsp:Transcript_22278/g.58079  ORF Transcript_22278/g.58079 Transcript_22278/m.58079 type:complete len:220 (-) Transcript_22278:1307-1966(-)
MMMLSVCSTCLATSPVRLAGCCRMLSKYTMMLCSRKKSKMRGSCWSPQIMNSAMERTVSTTTALLLSLMSGCRCSVSYSACKRSGVYRAFPSSSSPSAGVLLLNKLPQNSFSFWVAGFSIGRFDMLFRFYTSFFAVLLCTLCCCVEACIDPFLTFRSGRSIHTRPSMKKQIKDISHGHAQGVRSLQLELCSRHSGKKLHSRIDRHAGLLQHRHQLALGM